MAMFILFVADVIKSFDTVDRGILDCALGRLGLPEWFRKVFFSYHANVRLRFKLATGLGEAWTRDGGIPQGCPLSMVFIVALYVPWCRYLSSQQGVTPQLYAGNLKCTTVDGYILLEAARFTYQRIRAVGQEASPSKCVLLSTCKATRKDMWNWSISAGNRGWGTKLDVRDLGGHLEITNRARAGTLARRKQPPRFIWLVHSRLGFCARLVLLGLSLCLPVFMELKVLIFLVKI